MTTELKLIKDVHLGMCVEEGEAVVTSTYTYFHYLCDGQDDRGWGCGYRTLQTLCSWICHHPRLSKSIKRNSVPSLLEIQKALVEMQDKPKSFIGSKQWIGSVEVSLCLDYFYDVPGKILHISKGSDIVTVLPDLHQHFLVNGAPVMMGGETDNASKGIVGVRLDPPALLIVDPHSDRELEHEVRQKLQLSGFVRWMSVEEMHGEGFYNMCLPVVALR